MLCIGKKHYRDNVAAFIAALQASTKYRIDYRSYKCPHCKGWHLTKQRKNPQPKEQNHENSY